MDADPFRAKCIAWPEGRTCHSQWPGDVLRKVSAEAEARGGLDHQASIVDIDPVFPTLARIEQQWCLQSSLGAGGKARKLRNLGIAFDVGAPELIAESRGMSEKMAQRHRPLGSTQLGRPGCIETFQNPRIAKLRQDLGCWRVK